MFVGNIFSYFIGSTIGCDHTFVDNYYLVTNGLYFGENMGRKDNGMSFSQTFDKRAYLDYLIRVKTDSRLVKYKHGRIIDKRLSQTHTLTITL